MAKTKQKRGIPFWLQIVMILAAGCLAAAAVMIVSREYNVQKYTVTFAYSDGTVIEEKLVKDGQGVFPPVLSHNGVFRGWSKAFNAVTADVEAHPNIHDITEDNLFCFDSVYVQEGKTFELDVRIAGRVNVSSGTLTIGYDTDVLEYLHADNVIWCQVSEKQAGELTLVFNSDKTITEAMSLACLTFKAKEKDAYCTELSLSSQDVMIVVEGQAVPADHATINNKVYFLQEVG